ncbi:DUF6146 family protein [Flavobacterium aestivum]|uniref:DUF6146 family protein n=1 Tax=Flavobacterium aestivum TaxID=3003257 RepID=UPI0022866D73|nr:DUF6146 family protein [Flavobacterium aestivum]
MKNLIYISIILLAIIGCSSSQSTVPTKDTSKAESKDTIKIANKDLNYEVIIIESGFDTWLNSTAHPRGFYSQKYLEDKNYRYIMEWNNRVSQPLRYSPNLYEMRIDYDPNIDYGYEVNYLIYNYMIYFQNKYKQKLYGYVPPR